MIDTSMSDKLDQMTDLPPSAFVLHRNPMLLLDRIVSLNPESAVCEWHVREDDEFLVPGVGVPSYMGIEYMAQCVAVHGGACERALGFPPPQGFLLVCARSTAGFCQTIKWWSKPEFQYCNFHVETHNE